MTSEAKAIYFFRMGVVGALIPPRMRRWVRLGTLTGAVVASHAAASRAAAADEVSLATALFREGQAALDRGDVASACAKFARSVELLRGGGSVIALADCHERQGKTGSAWAEYQTALAIARRDGRSDRVNFVQTRLANLEKHLSKLAVNLAPSVAALDGVSLELDGVALPPEARGTLVPVDPGGHVIRATAPGRPPVVREIHVVEGEQTILVEFPPADSSPQPPTGRATPEAPAPTSRPTLGWVVLGSGALIAVAGGYFGIKALDAAGDARGSCPDGPCANADALARADDARRNAHVATALLSVGAITALVGIYVVLTSRPASARQSSHGPGGFMGIAF